MNGDIITQPIVDDIVTAKNDGAQQEYQEPAPADLLAPSEFQPLFILVEDPTTGEQFHPNLHYLFSDDDPEILTNEVLHALDRGSEKTALPKDQQQQQQQQLHPEVENRCAVLDLTADGKSISSIASLSAKWQALQAVILPTPSWGGPSHAQDDKILMKICSAEPDNLEIMPQHGPDVSLEDLVVRFNDSLDHIDDVFGVVRNAGGGNVETS